MAGFLQFALLGFGVGALYALASQGLIIIYRGSGVLNFALGAIGMVGRLRLVGAPDQAWGLLAGTRGRSGVLGGDRCAHPPPPDAAAAPASPLVQ